MPDTPPPLRGQLYNTKFGYRCLEFKRCTVCQMCENYNPTHIQCTSCEGRKPKGTRCTHRPHHKQAVRDLEEITKRPMFKQNPTTAELHTVDPGVSVAYNEKWDKIKDNLTDASGPTFKPIAGAENPFPEGTK